MMTELLPAHVRLALQQSQRLLPALLAGPKRLRDATDLCDKLRVAAIGSLFLTGRFAPFGRRLHQSARAYATAISQLPEAARLTSKARPFMDALAAGDHDAAAAIARLSRRTHQPGQEYEEDFFFHEVLMQRLFLGATAPALEQMLTGYEAALAGTEDPRLPLVQALIATDEAAFSAALTDYLNDRARKLDERAENQTIDPALLATEWHLSVEGVALVRVARALGMKTDSRYPQIPASALEPPQEDWSRSNWQQIDLSP